MSARRISAQLGAASALVVAFLAPCARASARPLTDLVVTGVELPFVQYERLSLEPISVLESDFDFTGDSARTRSFFGIGLAPGAHTASAADVPLAVSTHVGYALADSFVLGLRLGLGFASLSDEGMDSVGYWSVAVGPRAEYVFGQGWFRPFAGVETAIALTNSSGPGANRIEESSRMWLAGPTFGLHLFAGDAVAFDLRAAFTYGSGSQDDTIYVTTPSSITGSSDTVMQRQRTLDITRVEASLAVGVSAWL